MKKEYFNLALKNLQNRKLRSLLTMLGIFIAIATIFILISLSIGLQDAVKEQFRLLGADKFFIQPRGQAGPPSSGAAAQLTLDDVETIRKIPGVKDLSYFLIGNAEVVFEKQKRFFPVVAYPLDGNKVFQEVESYKPEDGRDLEKGDRGEVLLGSQYKHNNVFKTPVKVNDKIKINDVEFKVKAILKTVGNPGDDRLVYMSYEDFKDLFKSEDRVDQIMVQISQGEDIKEISEKTEKRLISSRGLTKKTRDFNILTPEEVLSSFGAVLNILTGFLFSIATISLLVGGIGIANTMYTSVLERTKEIGIMKAIGAKNSDILIIFLIESGLLGLVGGVVGVLLGIGISKSIEFIAVHYLATTLLKASAPPYLIFGCLLFAFLIGAISGTLPAFQAAKIKITDALRYE